MCRVRVAEKGLLRHVNWLPSTVPTPWRQWEDKPGILPSMTRRPNSTVPGPTFMPWSLGRRRRRATRPTTGVSSTTSRMVAPKVRTAQHPSSLIPRRISQHLRVPYRGRARARENSRNQCRLCRRRHKLHKLRNVTDRLPDALGSTVAKKLRAAYHIADRYKPRPNSRRWRASWTAPIPVRPPPCGKGWPRPSRSPGSACRRRWPARSEAPTRSSR